MEQLRRELIKAYFEGDWYEDEYGIDYESKRLIQIIDSRVEEVKIINGTWIQLEKGMQPPVSFVATGREDNKEVQVMIDTDKFCNIVDMFWE